MTMPQRFACPRGTPPPRAGGHPVRRRAAIAWRVAGLLGCFSCLPVPLGTAAAAGVTITTVEVDGDPRPLPEPAAAGRGRGPLRLFSTARSLRFTFAAADRSTRPAVRLRHKLEGHDADWQENPTRMRMLVLFSAPDGSLVGSREFYLDGETPQWRDGLHDALFVPRREQVAVPDGAAVAGIAFVSHGGESGLGVIGIDALRVLAERGDSGMTDVFDLGLVAGTDLDMPSGSPANWIRAGSRLEIAEVGIRDTPVPHPILVLRDDDPQNFGNWSLAPNHLIAVQPGDRLTVEWQTAHSIGAGGPAQADYGRLAAGSYWFRVAAVEASGAPAGEEASLRVEVVIPVLRRPETWLVVAAAAAGAAAWLGRAAVQRRMRRQIERMERERAVELERGRIARDLHDDIGAGLTEIAMQSDWVRRDLLHGPTAETRRRIESVCQSAVALVRNVDAIVWAVTPENDTLERFVSYLAQSAEQFLDAAGLRVRFDIPERLPGATLSGGRRHRLFLAVREALNNAVKHARADLVRLDVGVDGSRLRITVADDGCGFDPDATAVAAAGNGLGNMRRRMGEAGGRFTLTSRPGGGTRIELEMPLAPPGREPAAAGGGPRTP